MALLSLPTRLDGSFFLHGLHFEYLFLTNGLLTKHFLVIVRFVLIVSEFFFINGYV